MLGAIAFFFPQALGMGYGYIQQAIHGAYPIGFLLLFVAIKILATSLTISSGGSGGVFGPSLVIGGALGAAFGQAAAIYLPGLAPDPVASTMVGMCGFFAGVAKVPFASVIMVMEMTGSYGLLVPSLLVAAIAYLFLPVGIRLYENQLPSRSLSPAHQGSLAADLLRGATVEDCWEPESGGPQTVDENASLDSIAELASSTWSFVPVVDGTGRLAGELFLDELRRALLAGTDRDRVAVRDLMHSVSRPLFPQDDLATAARLLAERKNDGVTVVRSREGCQVLGTFTRGDLIAAYERKMKAPTDPEERELGFRSAD